MAGLFTVFGFPLKAGQRAMDEIPHRLHALLAFALNLPKKS
jgi:hypothetical protein